MTAGDAGSWSGTAQPCTSSIVPFSPDAHVGESSGLGAGSSKTLSPMLHEIKSAPKKEKPSRVDEPA